MRNNLILRENAVSKFKINFDIYFFVFSSLWLSLTIYPYQENEEDKEDVEQEEDGAEERVGLLDGREVEVAQDHPEQRYDGRRERSEVVALEKNVEPVILGVVKLAFAHTAFSAVECHVCGTHIFIIM